MLDLRGSEPCGFERAARRFAAVRRGIAASVQFDTRKLAYWSAVQGEMEALVRLGLPDQVADVLAAVRAEAGEPPDDVAATARHAAGLAFAPDQLVALVNAGRYDEARLLAGALRGDTQAVPDAAARDRLFGLAVLELQPGGDAELAAERFATVRADLSQARPVPDLYWAALRGEIEARSRRDGADAGDELRRQAVRELGLQATDIPEDLRDIEAVA